MHSLKSDHPTLSKEVGALTELDQRLPHVAVLGGAGKMGRGITLLLLLEMARTEVIATGSAGNGNFRLRVIDPNEHALHSLYWYLKPHLIRWAEKNINLLRSAYESRRELVDNVQVIETFVEEALRIVYPSSNAIDAADSQLIFEAIVEDIEIKVDIFRSIESQSSGTAFYFSNTSSIPIGILDKKAELNHRIIGFHFYNPPPKQPLVELISSKNSDPLLVTLAHELGSRLHKILIPSNDIAGFIGNGHFLREVGATLDTVERLQKEHGLAQALTLVDTVTREFLLRPMGMIQLLDYVGLDICQKIAAIMEEHIPELHVNTTLIQKMVDTGVYGGQYPDGSQKDGFFSYEKGVPAGVYDLQTSEYHALPAVDSLMGDKPASAQPWKSLSRNRNNEDFLQSYFSKLFAMDSLGATLAKEHALHSRSIAQGLIDDGVAEKTKDVNSVLKFGFAHLYGPFNEYY